MGEHPLTRLLHAAADGTLPPPDGEVEVLAAPPGPVDAIVSFTAHLVVATAIPSRDVRERLVPGDMSNWMHPSFLMWMSERLHSRPGSHDLVLAARGVDDSSDLELHLATDLGGHPRVRNASRHRTDVRVYTDPERLGVLVVGRGLAGRWEFAFEVEPEGRNRGLGRRLAVAARGCVPEGEPVFGQVAPGNAASVRSVLAAGFRPVGSEVLFPRSERGRPAARGSR
ncbi:MAG TPA: N-acetyltransferase [Acidimicrobiia bacterium]